VLSQPAFEALRPFEQLCLRTPINRHRSALRDAGAPVSDETCATSVPRRGLLSA
jgi:glutathione S-transferase